MLALLIVGTLYPIHRFTKVTARKAARKIIAVSQTLHFVSGSMSLLRALPIPVPPAEPEPVLDAALAWLVWHPLRSLGTLGSEITLDAETLRR